MPGESTPFWNLPMTGSVAAPTISTQQMQNYAQNGYSAGWGDWGGGYGAPNTESVLNTALTDVLPDMPSTPVPTSTAPAFWSLEGAFGGKNGGGWAMPLATVGIGAAQTYLGAQQLKLAKQDSKKHWAAWGLNYDNQANLVNAELADRQAFRNANGGVGAGMTPEQYVQTYGAKARG